MALLAAIKSLTTRCEAIDEKLEVIQCQLTELADREGGDLWQEIPIYRST